MRAPEVPPPKPPPLSAEVPGRTKEHTVRLWYALADLYERAGDVPRARALFEQVRKFDAEFADVAERLAALS